MTMTVRMLFLFLLFFTSFNIVAVRMRMPLMELMVVVSKILICGVLHIIVDAQVPVFLRKPLLVFGGHQTHGVLP